MPIYRTKSKGRARFTVSFYRDGRRMAAWFGSDLMRSLGNQKLARIFGCLLVVFGLRMLWKAEI